MEDSEKINEVESLITLQLDMGDREFRSIEELQEWMSQERSFFSWMEGGSKNDNNITQVWNATNQWLNYISSFINQHNQHKNNASQLKNLQKNLHNQINQSLEKGHLITSKNPYAIFGKKISDEEGEIVACYVIANLLNININPSNSKALKGAYLALQYQQGSTSTVQSQIESLELIAKEWNERFNDTHLKIRSTNENLIEDIEGLKNQFVSTKDDISSQSDEQRTAFSDHLEESKKTLSDIAHTYDEKLALQASVQYWSDKRTFHTKVMGWVGAGTLVLAILTGGGFVYAAHKLLQVTASEVELWRLGVMVAISTFGIWMTRLSSKIFISNLHLRTDADERVTMIQTYLALLREGSGPKDEERQLILQTLFRPSATGFIKDDGPSSFHDLVKNTLPKK